MNNQPEIALTALVAMQRKLIKQLAAEIKENTMNNINYSPKADIGETKANIMLAYRHLEDASMRLGKVIQAQDGGVSIYDK